MTIIEIPQSGPEGESPEHFNTKMGYFEDDFPVFGLDLSEKSVRDATGVKPPEKERYLTRGIDLGCAGPLIIGVEQLPLANPDA